MRATKANGADDPVTWSTRGQWRYALWKIMMGERTTWFIIFFSFLACLAFLFLCIRRFRKGGLLGIGVWMWGGLTAVCLYGMFSVPARLSYSLLAKVRAGEGVYSSVYWRVQNTYHQTDWCARLRGPKRVNGRPTVGRPSIHNMFRLGNLDWYRLLRGMGDWIHFTLCARKRREPVH